MKYKVGDKVKIVQFTETYLDAPKYTIGKVGTVGAIRLDQDDHIYRVTFENDPEGWNYKEDQLEHIDGMKNVQVKQLYVDVSDNDGRTYLIKMEYIEAFERELSIIESKLSFDLGYDEDDYYSDFENLLEYFDAQKLEGERVYIVLEEDLVKGETR